MELLKKLYTIYAPSGKEKRMREFIRKYVKANIPDAVACEDAAGNLYISRGNSETYPCVVAHLDQVQRLHSRDFTAVETRDIIFGYSPSRRRQEGLGADDKNGIWIALKCLKRYKVMKVAFFVEEEVGCVGSGAADLDFFTDCRFVIEPDRRGYGDLITQIGHGQLCSDGFLADIAPERFGYKATEGLMTDIEALRDGGMALSCVNLSCGYYEPHTDREFTVKKDLVNCLAFVQDIIETCTKTYPCECEEFYEYPYLSFETEDMLYDIMQAHPDFSAEDAWDVYQTNFPKFTRENFLAVYDEYRLAFGFEDLTEEEFDYSGENAEDKRTKAWKWPSWPDFGTSKKNGNENREL